MDTFAIFKFSGNIPCCNKRLKTYFRGVKNISEVSFTTFEEILSNPGHLLGFRLLKASYTSSSVRFASLWGFDVGLDTDQIFFAIQESLRLVLDQCLQRTYCYFSLIKYFLTIYNHSFRKTVFSWFCSHDFFILFW